MIKNKKNMQNIKRSIVGLFAFAAVFAANAQPAWTVDENRYETNMTIIAQLNIEGNLSSNSADMIGIFYEGECRGAAKNDYVFGGQTYAKITIYGNTDGEKLTIKIYDAASGETYELKQQLYYTKNADMGTFNEPYVFYTNLNDKKIKAYNFFTPNGDGKNDYFIVDDLMAVRDMTFKVLTLKGEEVYMQKDYDNSWDGTSKNGKELPKGAYYYLFIDDKGKTIYHGSITLVR